MPILAVDVNVLTAFGAGILSFLSPCVLPLIPVYLSLVTGLTVGELEKPEPQQLRRIAITTSLFILGFTVVFVGLSLVATGFGQALNEHQDALTRISGGVVLLLAVYLAGSQVLMLPSVYREVRFAPHLERFGPFAAPITGAAFGLGWTPCLSPTLGAVLALAATEGNTLKGAYLLVAYSAGLGAAFLAVGLGLGRLTAPLAFVKRHARAITFISAALLGALGLLLLFNRLSWLTAHLGTWGRDIGLGWLFDQTG